MKTIITILILTLAFVTGCDLAKPQGAVKREREREQAEQAPGEALAAPQEKPTAAQQVPDEPKKAEEAAVPEPKPEQETVQVKADVGATGKGRYGQRGGEVATDIITVPLSVHFQAKEMTVFRMQIPKTMQLYKAEHNDKGPPTQEEYMRDIIEAGGITLPKLPEGHEYVYNPETEELMVKKPKN